MIVLVLVLPPSGSEPQFERRTPELKAPFSTRSPYEAGLNASFGSWFGDMPNVPNAL